MDMQQEIARMYNRDDMISYYERFTQQGFSEFEQKLMSRYFMSPAALLVIGCGTGREIFPLQKQGFDVMGIDLAWGMLCKANEKRRALHAQQNSVPKNTIYLQQGNALHLPYQNERFDHVLMISQTIQHIPKRRGRQQVMREIYRVVKPGGCCLLSAFNKPISFWYLFLWGRQQRHLFHKQQHTDTARQEEVPNSAGAFNALQNLQHALNGKNRLNRFVVRVIKKLCWELYPPVRNFSDPLPLTTRVLFFVWCTLTNWQRILRSKFGKHSEHILESDDLLLDFPDFTFRVLSGRGNLFMHFPDIDEMRADITSAGFELLEYRSQEELQQDHIFSEKIRNSKRLLFYVARKNTDGVSETCQQ